MVTNPAIKRALLSATDKTGLVEFANQLAILDVEIIATGGTARLLRQHHISVIDVADYTGFPEIMNGRVKTLHPKIHGGLLGRRGIDDDSMEQQQIPPIDLLVVNLYPFQKNIAQPDTTIQKALEQIDIGGPSLLRAGAKNHEYITVLIDPADYAIVLHEIKTHGNTIHSTRRYLAQKVFAHTAAYDAAIALYLQQQIKTDLFPKQLTLTLHKQMDLRYGENPHQRAACYINSVAPSPGSLIAAQLLQGKPLSYNNLIDSDAALHCVRAFDKNTPACVIVKHATPCGVAQGDTLRNAYQKALNTDPISAFGGIIAFNQRLDVETTKTLLSEQFVEVLLAPEIDSAALTKLNSKSNLRVLLCGYPTATENICLRSISGGFLRQENDNIDIHVNDLTVVTQRKPSHEEIKDLLFAWKVVRFVKSNAIVYAKNRGTLGIGTGQTSRIFSAKIAILKAKEADLSLKGAVMASDAFFPFADSAEVAAQSGISAIIQPGGSKRDAEVIASADAMGLAMVFTGMRRFRH